MPTQTVITVDKTDRVWMDEQAGIKRGMLKNTLDEAFGKVLTPNVQGARMAI